MIPLRCINTPSISNVSNVSFVSKKTKAKKSKNLNLSNLLVCDDQAMIERISLNSAIHSTQRNTKTSKGSSRVNAFSKGDRYKILNQQQYTDQDFDCMNNQNMTGEYSYLQNQDQNIRCQTTENRSSKNYNYPFNQEMQRTYLKTEEGSYLNKSQNNQPSPLMNSFLHNTPINRERPYIIPQTNDKNNQDQIQKLQLFIKPSYIKQRDYLSIDVRSRKQSIGDVDKNSRTYGGDNAETLHQIGQSEGKYSQQRRSSNSCMGKYTIDIPSTLPTGNSQTIQFQDRAIRSITPSILSTSTHAATLTMNKSFSKGRKYLSSSKNSSLTNQSSFKKKLKLSKKESKSPKPHDIIPLSVSSSYSRNVPLRITKNPDLKVLSILGAYDQHGLGNFIFNKKQFKQYLKNLNFKTPQEEQQMIKYMFIYFKEWQKRINRNIDMIKLQLFSIKVEDLEEESLDIQRYIRKKANQAKRIKKCISVLLNYTKSKRDNRKLKQINQKCSEYDSLLKTMNVIHTLKMRVEGYLVNKIQKTTPTKKLYLTPQQILQDQQFVFNNLNINQQFDQIQNEEFIDTNQPNNTQKIRINDFMQQHSTQLRDINSIQPKRNSSKSPHEYIVSHNEQDASRAQSRRNNTDLSDDDFQISQSRVNSEGIFLYDKRKSSENQFYQQQVISDHNQVKLTPLSNVTPFRSNRKDDSDFYKISLPRESQNTNNVSPIDQIEKRAEKDTINFQKDVVNIRSLKPISLNNEEDQQQKTTLNQASLDNMIKNGSTNTNYQDSMMMINNNSSDKQTPKQCKNKPLTNSKIEEVGETDDTPRRKCPQKDIPQNNKRKNKSQLKYESLERVIKETIAEQSMSIRHKSIFQNYIDSIRIPLEDLQKQGEDVQQIFEVFNDLMQSFQEKIIDHSQNCVDLNKWDILLQYLKDFSQLIDESVRLGSELMKVSQSKALPLTVTNRAVVYLQEAQEKYREVSGKVKDSLKELVNHMWDLIENGIHLNSSDRQYEEAFKFMADIRDSVKQSQVNDYQNKEKLCIIDEIAQSLNELYKISYSIQAMVQQKQLVFVDSPSFTFIKDVKSLCHSFKVIYRNMIDSLDQITGEGDSKIKNFNRQSLGQTSNQRKNINPSIQTVSSIIEREQVKGEKDQIKGRREYGNGGREHIMGERRGSHGQLIGISLIERQCEEIEDLFEINRWFVSNSQDIDHLVIFEDPSKIPDVYSMNEEGKRKFQSEMSIGVGVLLQLRENAEDIIDISASQNLSSIVKNVRLAQEKYQQLADIALIAAELCNLQHDINYQSLQDQFEDKSNSIKHLYEIIDRLKVSNKSIFESNVWLIKFIHRLINGTLYFEFSLKEYPILCETMHSILTEYSSRTKYSIPNTDQFFKCKAVVESKIELIRSNKNMAEESIASNIEGKIHFLESRVVFAINLFGSNNFVLPNGSLLCKILDAFFERIVHAKPFNKLSEQFDKLRVFMMKGIEIICKEKEVLCSKRETNASVSSASSLIESDEEKRKNEQRKSKGSSYYYPLINKSTDMQPNSKSTAATSCINSTTNAYAQSAHKTSNIQQTPTSSGFKKVPPMKELRFQHEQGSISTQGKNVSTENEDRQFTGRINYYDNILEEAESLCKNCSLFIPSKGDENNNKKQEGDYMQNFSILVYEEFLQLCSKYLLAKRDKVNIYSNIQLRVKWIAPYNEEQSIFQQKYSFIEKYILPPDQSSSQEAIIDHTKHINQIFHKNGPIFYKYDFRSFQSYIQLFIDTPSSNFQVLITLESDPSAVLYQGNLENQRISTLLPINDIFTNVRMVLICKDINQPTDSNQILMKSVRSSIDSNKVYEDQVEVGQQESNRNVEQENTKQDKQDTYDDSESKNKQITITESSWIKKSHKSDKQVQQNQNIITSVVKDQLPYLRHKSSHIFLMRAQKITQLRISNLNYNLKDGELFKIFYRSHMLQQQKEQKSSLLFQKKPQLEVFCIINESEVVFRRKHISIDKNIILSQNSATIQEWTISTAYQKSIGTSNTKIIDFYVKIQSVEEGSFYIYDKNNFYSIKSSLLLKQEGVLQEAGVNVQEDQQEKEKIIESVNKLLPDKYWHAFSIIESNQFQERSRLTSQPYILKNLS